MMESLLEWERNAFLWINGTHTSFLDVFFWPFSGILVWCPLLLVPLYFIWRRPKNWIPALISLVLIPVFCFIASELLFKPFFTRFRPTTHPAFMDVVTLLREYTADGLYGFISGHTTNAFGFAVLSLLLIKNKAYTVFILFWAFLMAYSRIYLGAHFITDVTGGMIVGILLGIFTYILYRYLSRRYFKPPEGAY